MGCMENLPVYDCQQCGACCIDYFGTRGYINLGRGEPERLRRLGLPVVQLYGRPYLGTQPHTGPGGDTVCTAFSGSVSGDCACTIYPDRPHECRKFTMGSLPCQFARIEAGLP